MSVDGNLSKSGSAEQLLTILDNEDRIITEDPTTSWLKYPIGAIGCSGAIAGVVLRARSHDPITSVITELAVGAMGAIATAALVPGEFLSEMTKKIVPISVDALQVMTLFALNADWYGGEEVEKVIQGMIAVFTGFLIMNNFYTYLTARGSERGEGALYQLGASTPKNRKKPLLRYGITTLLGAGTAIGLGFGKQGATILGRIATWTSFIPLGMQIGSDHAYSLAWEESSLKSSVVFTGKLASALGPLLLSSLTTVATRTNNLWYLMSGVGICHGISLSNDYITLGRRTLRQPQLSLTEDLVKRFINATSLIGNIAMLSFIGYEAFGDPDTNGRRNKLALGLFTFALYSSYSAALASVRKAGSVASSTFAKIAYFFLIENRLSLPLMYIFSHGVVDSMNDNDIESAPRSHLPFTDAAYFIYGAILGLNRITSGIRETMFVPMLYMFFTVMFVDHRMHGEE